MSFFSRFKDIRLYTGLNQGDFGTVFGVKQKTISNWENGRNEPDMRVLDILSKEWAININWLLTGKGEMHLNDNNSSISISGENSGVIVAGGNNGNININTNKFNHKEDIKEIIELLEFAPSGFLTIIKEKLLEFRKLSQF